MPTTHEATATWRGDLATGKVREAIAQAAPGGGGHN